MTRRSLKRLMLLRRKKYDDHRGRSPNIDRFINKFPIFSLSFPKQAAAFESAVLFPFFFGLLAEGDNKSLGRKDMNGIGALPRNTIVYVPGGTDAATTTPMTPSALSGAMVRG